MSGSFERQIYDVNAYSKSLEQSTNPLKYLLDPIAVNRCDPCRVSQPGYNGRVGVSITHQRPLVDVESDLMLLNYRNTKDPNQKFKPSCSQCGECIEGYPCGGGVVASCNNCQEKLFHLPVCNAPFTDSTRISNPICTARGIGINRFQPLCLNPQDENRWLQPSEVGINYRMVVKDNHTPCIPKLVDPTPLLPKGLGPVKYPGQMSVASGSPPGCNIGVHRAALHKHGKVNRNWNNAKFV
jgi:hypothetical protein